MRSTPRLPRRRHVCVKVDRVVACCPRCGDFDFRVAADTASAHYYQCSTCKHLVTRTELIDQIAKKLVEQHVVHA